MKCINCGRELSPDTVECPFCMEDEKQKVKFKKERHKIYITLSICCLVLILIIVAVLIFMPDTSFQREMESADGSYAVAALCEGSPNEAADSRYQLILLDAVDYIESRYNDQTCGYDQTVMALKQIYSVNNPVVRDHAEDVWSNVERMRFYQLLNNKRAENSIDELTWSSDVTMAAESIADEYSAVGLDYEQNAEKLIRNLLADDTDKITVFTLLNTANAQDALEKYEGDSDSSKGTDLIFGSDISLAGIDAVYDTKSGLWSFFILAE